MFEIKVIHLNCTYFMYGTHSSPTSRF